MTQVLERPVGEATPGPFKTTTSFEDALRKARKDWQVLEVDSVKQQQDAYQRAVNAYAKTVQATKGPVSHARRQELYDALNAHQAALADDSLNYLTKGVGTAYRTGVETAYGHTEWLNDAVPNAKYDALVTSYSENELATYLARTRVNGLTLSDETWKAADVGFAQTITPLIEEAIVTGMSTRDLAKRIDQIASPKGATASDLTARDAAGAPKKISYAAERLARTEINNAGREGTIAAHSLSPFTQGFQWHRSKQRENIDCPPKNSKAINGCSQLVKGIVNGVQVGSGTGVYDPDDVPISHPNCRCYITPVMTDSAKATRDLENWLEDPTGPRNVELEKWYRGIEPLVAGATPPPPPPPPPPPKPKPVKLRPSDTPITPPEIPSDLNRDNRMAMDIHARNERDAAAGVLNEANVSDQAYKKRISEELADRVQDDAAFAQYARDRVNEWELDDIKFKITGGAPWDQGPGALPISEQRLTRFGNIDPDRLQRELVEHATSDLVHQWAVTSADKNSKSLALQLAVRDEFNLKGDSVRHFSRNAMRDAKVEYKAHEEAYRTFARAVYDNTQAQLAAEGVDEMTLYRGMSFADAEDAKRVGVPESSLGTVVEADLKLQPVSSFAYDYGASESFAHGDGTRPVMAAVRVPRQRIYSTMHSGIGCKGECEVVVFGGPTRANVTSGQMGSWGRPSIHLGTPAELVAGKKF